MAGRRSVRLGPAARGAMGWGQAPALHYSQGLWISAAVAPTTPSLDSGPVSESGTCRRNSDAHKTSLPKSGRLRSEFGEVLYTLCQ